MSCAGSDRWPHLERLRTEQSQASPDPNRVQDDGPFGFITQIIKGSGFEALNDKIDITMIQLSETSAGGGDISYVGCTHWEQEGDLDGFLHQLESGAFGNNTTIILLVQGMSLAMLNFLSGELSLPPAFILSYCLGSYGPSEVEILEVLKAHYDPDVRRSWPGCKLSREFRYSFETLCSKRQISSPKKPWFNFDWRFLVPTFEGGPQDGTTALQRISASNSVLTEPQRFHLAREQSHAASAEISAQAHRPMQVIFEVKEYPKGSKSSIESVEERVSWTSANFDGHNTEVYLFDPKPHSQSAARSAALTPTSQDKFREGLEH
ncbi:hypothetical protein ABW19_dt0208482 [Dactylella cylindrospora]|nr:hypothetical protein ABW19_dt0208482 [Dactylella cylindrospora]